MQRLPARLVVAPAIPQSSLEDLARDVFGIGPVADAVRDVGIDAPDRADAGFASGSRRIRALRGSRRMRPECGNSAATCWSDRDSLLARRCTREVVPELPVPGVHRDRFPEAPARLGQEACGELGLAECLPWGRRPRHQQPRTPCVVRCGRPFAVLACGRAPAERGIADQRDRGEGGGHDRAVRRAPSGAGAESGSRAPDLRATSSIAAPHRSPASVTAGSSQSQSTPVWTRYATYAPTAAGTSGCRRARRSAASGVAVRRAAGPADRPDLGERLHVQAVRVAHAPDVRRLVRRGSSARTCRRRLRAPDAPRFVPGEPPEVGAAVPGEIWQAAVQIRLDDEAAVP